MKSFGNCGDCYQKNHLKTQKNWSGWDFTWQMSSKGVDQSYLTTDSFTIEFIYNGCGKVFPGQYTQLPNNFFGGASESRICHNFGNIVPHQCNKKLKRENICFLTQNFKTLQNIIFRNPIATIQIAIVWKPLTCSFKRDTITQKLLSRSKCFQERKKLRFNSLWKDRALHFLVRI